jgi:hypothetical protein
MHPSDFVRRGMRRPVNGGSEGAIPASLTSGRTQRHLDSRQDLALRGAGYRGSPRAEMRVAQPNVWISDQPAARTKRSDAVRARRGDMRCPGVD